MSPFVNLQALEVRLDEALRVFDCPWCGKRVFICRRCDRGQVYCGAGCRRAARRASQRESGRRYQRTLRGRMNHARRQARYRRRKKIVTHQGSPSSGASPKQAPGPKKKEPGPHEARKGDSFFFRPAIPEEEVHTCRFCGRARSQFLRIDFLHTPSRKRE